MSASREKKVRKDVQDTVTSQQHAERQAHKSQTRKNVLIGVAVTLVVVLLIGSIVLLKGPYFRQNSTAVTVGEHELSPVTVRYFYRDAFLNIQNTYGSYLSTLYDTSSSFDEAVYDEESGQTWGDVLMDQTMTTIASTYAVYDEAVASGYELSEDAEAELSSLSSTVSLYASMSGITADGYIRSIYGSGCDLDSYLDYQNVLIYVSDYESSILDGYTYSEDEIAAAYQDAPEDYDRYTYHATLISAVADEDNEDDADGMKAAKKSAKNFASEAKGDLDRYLELSKELTENEDYESLRSDYRASSISATSEDILEWVSDPDRKEGDTTFIQYEDVGYYVLYYVSTNTNDYDAMNLRCIQISASSTDTDGNTTLDWDAAQTKLDEMTAAFEEYDDMLEGFDALASTYSSDSSTNQNGGAYETVYHGQFESAVDDWIFDSEREDGDNAVIQGEDSYYFVYLEGSAGNYRDYLVDQALRNSDYTDWYEALTQDSTCDQEDFGMKYVERTLTVSSAS